MLTKIAVAFVIVAATATGSLAAAKKRHSANPVRDAYAATPAGSLVATKKQHSTNPAWDVYDTRGRYVGSDPDPFIRDSLARDDRAE
jgi:hypothetical protein